MSSPLIRYHLSTTVVNIQGVVTTKKEYMSDNSIVDTIDKIDIRDLLLSAIADPDCYYCIDLEKTKISDDTFAIELSDDGRIITTDSNSTGKIGTTVNSIAGFVTNVVAVASNLTSPATVALSGLKKTAFNDSQAAERESHISYKLDLENIYETEFPERALRRKNVRKAIDTLTDKLIELNLSIANEGSEQRREELVKYTNQIKTSLTDLHVQNDSIESIFSAWKNVMQDEEENIYSFTLDIDDLLESSSIEEMVKEINHQEKLEKLIEEKSCQLRDVYQKLQFVLSKRDYSPYTYDNEDELPKDFVSPELPGTSFPGIFCRRPRLVEFTIWKIDATDRLFPVSKTVRSILDRHSRLFTIEFGKSNWSNHNAKVSFHPTNGALKTLSTSNTSALSAASNVFSQLPKEVLANLEAANKIQAQLQKIEGENINKQIARMNREKKKIEAAIALDGAIATKKQKSEIAKYKALIERLKLYQEIDKL
jgi:hypothetical protein